jgi:hypothetical protein
MFPQDSSSPPLKKSSWWVHTNLEEQPNTTNMAVFRLCLLTMGPRKSTKIHSRGLVTTSLLWNHGQVWPSGNPDTASQNYIYLFSCPANRKPFCLSVFVIPSWALSVELWKYSSTMSLNNSWRR